MVSQKTVKNFVKYYVVALDYFLSLKSQLEIGSLRLAFQKNQEILITSKIL